VEKKAVEIGQRPLAGLPDFCTSVSRNGKIIGGKWEEKKI